MFVVSLFIWAKVVILDFVGCILGFVGVILGFIDVILDIVLPIQEFEVYILKFTFFTQFYARKWCHLERPNDTFSVGLLPLCYCL